MKPIIKRLAFEVNASLGKKNDPVDVGVRGSYATLSRDNSFGFSALTGGAVNSRGAVNKSSLAFGANANLDGVLRGLNTNAGYGSDAFGPVNLSSGLYWNRPEDRSWSIVRQDNG